ncbi:MAG: hypothetical protein K1X78_10835 [Verrucomicrobiaceae bacterium]|nr:hypothetical protein [Verrucomicrobiaceae bacterium]
MKTRPSSHWLPALLISSFAICHSSFVIAQSTISAANPHAWSANTGFITFRHGSPVADSGIVIGDAVLSGKAWSANCGWIDFGDGTPANGYFYGNGNNTDYGVNHFAGGALSGLAYGANIGWISFGYGIALDSPNHPRVNYLTGELTGYAWSANCGWINLASNGLRAATIKYVDTDNDGIADAWEIENFGNLAAASATSDADGDGVSDKNEFIAFTDPFDAESKLRIVSLSENAALHRTTLEFTTSPVRMYRIETTTDLANWAAFSPALNYFAPVPNVASTTVVLDHGADARRFYRPVAVLPLSP